MRPSALIALICLFLSATPAAGQTDAEGPARPNSLTAGKTAFQFVLKAEPDDSFGSGIEGAVKRHHSDGGAVRLGFEIDWGRNESTSTELISDPVDGDSTFTRRYEDSSWVLGGDLLWIGYPVRGGVVNLYWGLGPTAGFAKRKSTVGYTSSDPAAPVRRDEQTLNTWTLGGKALLGLEWFAAERVSLYAEYRAWLVYSSRDGEAVARFGDETRRQDSDGTGWDAQSSAVLVGFAAYF